MKKILSFTLVLLVLCTLLSFTTFAEATAASEKAEVLDNYCTINKNFESITFNNKTYLPIEKDAFSVSRTEYIDLNEKFADDSTEDIYKYTDVYYYSGLSYLLHVDIETDFNYTTKYYVEESHYADFLNVLNGETISAYGTESHYSSIYSFSLEQVESWIENGEKIVDRADSLADCEIFYLYATDKGGALRKESGMILRKHSTDDGADKYYLVFYQDYDRTHFYADGRFAIDSDVETTFYLLADTELSAALSEFYDTEPEDELDWMITGALPQGIFFVITLLFFALLPLAIIIVSAIVLLKKRQNNPYRLSLVTVMISAFAVIIGYLVILILII